MLLSIKKLHMVLNYGMLVIDQFVTKHSHNLTDTIGEHQHLSTKLHGIKTDFSENKLFVGPIRDNEFDIHQRLSTKLHGIRTDFSENKLFVGPIRDNEFDFFYYLLCYKSAQKNATYITEMLNATIQASLPPL
jgi:hypothetical protein